MPNMIKSKAQNAAMHAAAAGKSTLGIPKAVGKEAIATQTKSIKKMPQHVAKKKKPERHFGSLAPDHDSDYR